MKRLNRRRQINGETSSRVTQSVSIGKSYGEQSFNNEPLSRVRRRILVIHGRDELNLLRLKELIRDRWNLDVVTPGVIPALGKTIIEKFEGAAADAVGAIVLLTPDDLVTFGGRRYHQARPNVYLELGWAYHRFGRRRIYLLCQQGTTVPSDLAGINRIDFRENVLDVAQALEAAFEAVGMLDPPNALRTIHVEGTVPASARQSSPRKSTRE